jgi:hypothetical protein
LRVKLNARVFFYFDCTQSESRIRTVPHSMASPPRSPQAVKVAESFAQAQDSIVAARHRPVSAKGRVRSALPVPAAVSPSSMKAMAHQATRAYLKGAHDDSLSMTTPPASSVQGSEFAPMPETIEFMTVESNPWAMRSRRPKSAKGRTRSPVGRSSGGGSPPTTPPAAAVSPLLFAGRHDIDRIAELLPASPFAVASSGGHEYREIVPRTDARTFSNERCIERDHQHTHASVAFSNELPAGDSEGVHNLFIMFWLFR